MRLFIDKKMAYVFDLIDIFNRDPDVKYRKKFKNILERHGEKRAQIYINEEYPFDNIELQLRGNNF